MSGSVRAASLPMYAFPETHAATMALWSALQSRLVQAGLDVSGVAFDRGRAPVPDGIGPEVLFTQICGYPLFKRFRDEGRMLATPRYIFAGCEEGRHCGFFIARADDPSSGLEDFKGKIFGCNSLLSNSGMNLPRLSLARIAQGHRFFSSVIFTQGHLKSLERLRDGAIDLCSIDNVTWGLFQKVRPREAAGFRVLSSTVSSPCLPFVTSSQTSDEEATVLRRELYAVMIDESTVNIRKSLGLAGLEKPDVAAYEQLADYEREAARLGYPEII